VVAVHHLRHLLRANRLDAAAKRIDYLVDQPSHAGLWPYAAIVWRLNGDARYGWLENRSGLVGMFDLADHLPPLDALADRLRALHRARAQHLDQSVRGGTQTDGILFANIDPLIESVREVVRSAVADYIAGLPPVDPSHPTLAPRRDKTPRFSGSWSVRLRAGGHHAHHVHPAGWISSALYIDLPGKRAGEPGEAGWLALGLPERELGIDLPATRLIEPKPGRLVLFPSTMWHGTIPFDAGERLTIAFDVAHPAA
jgi:hypothetical protein